MAEIICYKCGATLTKQDVCLQCGEDMRLYKRIFYNADVLYNLGLERAKVRDLSGAKAYLLQCIQASKEHVQARNLLGLVYYELGEPALALKQWILSTSFQPDNNLANKYLKNTEKNLAGINSAVNRYNIALEYLRGGNRDLAVIQLRQMMNKPYPVLRAMHLLALLYIQDEHLGRAQRILKECKKIDEGNATTNRYLRAIEEKKKQNHNDSYRQAVSEAVAGNSTDSDVIIPHTNKEYGSYFLYVLYILIGLIVGAGLVYFIVVPTVRSKEQDKAREALLSYEASLSEWQIDTVKLNSEIEALNKKTGELQNTISSMESAGGGVQFSTFMPILKAYAENSPRDIVEEFKKLDPESDNESYRTIYKIISADIVSSLGERAFYRGMQYLEAAEASQAIDMIKYSVELTGYTPQKLYYLGRAYHFIRQFGWAVYYYQYCIATYPTDFHSYYAQTMINNILVEDPEIEVPNLTPGELGTGINENSIVVPPTSEAADESEDNNQESESTDEQPSDEGESSEEGSDEEISSDEQNTEEQEPAEGQENPEEPGEAENPENQENQEEQEN